MKIVKLQSDFFSSCESFVFMLIIAGDSEQQALIEHEVPESSKDTEGHIKKE